MNSTTDSNKTGDAENDIKPKVTLDTILENEIGHFGKFQLRTLLLGAIVGNFAAWGTMEYVFTTARINTRCAIPECDSAQPEWSPYWLSNAVPATGARAFDNCQRYGNASTVMHQTRTMAEKGRLSADKGVLIHVLRQVESNMCPSTLFDRNTLQPCDEYVYENTHTVVYDFELACDEWRRALIGTVRTIGTLIALPITGYVSDHWGRRTALTIGAINTCWLGIVRYWSNTYIGFMLSEFFEALFGCGVYASNYIMCTELMGPKYRITVGAAINTFTAIGQISLGLIAWLVPNWRNLTLAVYIPQLTVIIYFWFLSESVRWYLSKGRFDESDALLKKVAKMNNRQISEKSLKALRDTLLEERERNALEGNTTAKEPWLIVQVFQHKKILLRCIIVPVWWVTGTLIFYGLSFNAVNMSGNRYLNFIAVAAAGIPGYWTAVILMKYIGRKPVLIIAFWLCAAGQIAYIFVPSDLEAVSLPVYLIARFAMGMEVTTLYIYTTELFPTKYRHSLFAYSSMIGRIGSMVAPLTPAFSAQWFEKFPFVLFAGFAFVSGVLVFFTPETHNTKLPDTFEEACKSGLKDRSAKK